MPPKNDILNSIKSGNIVTRSSTSSSLSNSDIMSVFKTFQSEFLDANKKLSDTQIFLFKELKRDL